MTPFRVLTLGVALTLTTAQLAAAQTKTTAKKTTAPTKKTTAAKPAPVPKTAAKATPVIPVKLPLSSEEAAGGLREALSQGVSRAVELAGQADGFNANPEIRIPFPP